MIKLYFKSLNHLLELVDNITIINFDNAKLYRSLLLNIDDEIILSIDNKEFQISKYGLVINNPLDIDINNKKLVTALLKELSLHITDENKMKLNIIEKQILDILDDISYDSTFKISYNNDLNIMNIFSLYNVCFANISFDNYVELLINYIKINYEYLKYKIVITNNLINILTIEEYELFKKELKIYDIFLLDIQCNKMNYIINYVNVDEDFCII